MKKMIVPSLDYLLEHFEIMPDLPNPERLSSEQREHRLAESPPPIASPFGTSLGPESTSRYRSFLVQKFRNVNNQKFCFWVETTPTQEHKIASLETELRLIKKRIRESQEPLRGI